MNIVFYNQIKLASQPHKLRLFFAIFILLVLPSCTTVSEDCICTAEFRTIAVYVRDKTNEPVEGLTTIISDETGKIYDIKNESFLSGYYPVMTDSYVMNFSPSSKKILFAGIKDSLEVRAEFLVNTDKCRCHVQKVSGPDTLVLD